MSGKKKRLVRIPAQPSLTRREPLAELDKGLAPGAPVFRGAAGMQTAERMAQASGLCPVGAQGHAWAPWLVLGGQAHTVCGNCGRHMSMDLGPAGRPLPREGAG